MRDDAAPSSLIAFATGSNALLSPRRRARATCRRQPRMSSQPPPAQATAQTQPAHDRLLRLERALATAVTQERYTDAARLRDALAAARSSDPLLSLRDQLADAVANQDFAAAAQARDELAALTERLALAPAHQRRRVDRLLILRGRANPNNALRVATTAPSGAVRLELLPERFAPPASSSEPPRVFLQPTWSPTADYVAFTEVSFRIESVQGMRAVSISDSECRVVVMNALDGKVVKAVDVRKPPFFYSWSPCGKTLTFLANDPDSSQPRVALSAIRVVAPAGGANADLDLVHGPIASAHPLLFDFCPRDSTRIVAHLGNINTVAVVPVAANTFASRNLTSCAGSFGTPQWHPIQGKDGREVVIFVEAVPSEKGDETRSRGVTGMRSIFSPVDKDDDNDGKSAIDSIIGSGGSMLENFIRQGARRLGFKNDDDDKKDSTSLDENGEPLSAEEDMKEAEKKIAEVEAMLGQRFHGKLRQLLPERRSQWGSDKSDSSTLDSKPMQHLVMCDTTDPTKKRILTRFTGMMSFKLSPDGQKLVTMITDPESGHDELVLTQGDYSPDSVESEDSGISKARGWVKRGSGRGEPTPADVILSTPKSRVLAFFWSPDSRRLLFLSSIRGTRCGAVQWATFDTVTNRVTRYEKIVLSGIYVHCLNFFDQFADAMTPWSPDGKSFCYPARRLTPAERERDDTAPVAAPASPLLAALLLHKENSGESKGFAAWVQRVPDEENPETSDPDKVVDNVEFASWSPC